MLSKIHSLTVHGMECENVEVEVDILGGHPHFNVVGLGDTAVQESRERVRSAVRNSGSGYHFPTTRITVNLAPANVKKNGVLYDLPIAIGIIISSEQYIPILNISKTLFIGELALDGSLRPVNGVLPMMIHAKKNEFERIILPKVNAPEASLINGVEIIAAENLNEILSYLAGSENLIPVSVFDFSKFEPKYSSSLDFAQVKGQVFAKRALEIAAAGSHNILMCGSPGSGKTLMARTFQTILPKITLDEALEITKIYSIANKLPPKTALISKRPFRTVHHTASAISIIGGGTIPTPGEVSLAHKGVLFLDEMPEFPTSVLEVMRQPLEDKKITVTRVNGVSEFPADFTLVAAMNPCPCGYYNVPNSKKECNCAQMAINKYQKKISGPLLDRIDLYVDVSPVEFDKLKKQQDEEPSESIRNRVQFARDIQIKRFKDLEISSNSEMENKLIKQYCKVPQEAEHLLKMAVNQMNLSARAYHRVLKVARTIADLGGRDNIDVEDIAEALQYRRKED